MPELGRAALLVTLGLCLYALVAGSAAAALRREQQLQARAHDGMVVDDENSGGHRAEV